MAGGFEAEADMAVDFRKTLVAHLVGHAQTDIGVALNEGAQVSGKPARGPGWRRNDAQALAQIGHAHRLQGALDVVEGLRQVRGEGGAGFGQGQALGRADEQRHAKVVFQLFDLPADGALGDVQFQGCLAETAMPRDLFEDAQHVERGQLTHGRGLISDVFCSVYLTIGNEPMQVLFGLTPSRASPLPQVLWCARIFCTTRTLWEPMQLLFGLTPSRASPLPQVLWCARIFLYDADIVGAGLPAKASSWTPKPPDQK
jgi:hypothetical protein